MLRGSEKDQNRILTFIGLAVLLAIVLTVVVVVANPFGGDAGRDRLSIVINTPYVGQGVESGTAVVLHGVEVGQVSRVENRVGGGVRLVADLDSTPTQGLTDAMKFDFRPVNFFGVTGVDLQPGQGGNPLRDGSEVTALPTGNHTLSQLLSQLGDVSKASLTPRFISVIDRVTRYTDGLNPLFETAITVTRAIADVQTVSTEQLLANTASVTAAVPEFLDAAIEANRRILDYNYYPGQTFSPAATIPQRLSPPYLEGVKMPNLADETEEYFQAAPIGFAKVASAGLFAAVGKLESTHVDDLFGLVTGLKAVTDVTPPLLRPVDIAQKLAELRSRTEKLYAGNGEQHAISLRIVLDSLPGVAAPIGITAEATP